MGGTPSRLASFCASPVHLARPHGVDGVGCKRMRPEVALVHALPGGEHQQEVVVVPVQGRPRRCRPAPVQWSGCRSSPRAARRWGRWPGSGRDSRSWGCGGSAGASGGPACTTSKSTMGTAGVRSEDPGVPLDTEGTFGDGLQRAGGTLLLSEGPMEPAARLAARGGPRARLGILKITTLSPTPPIAPPHSAP